MAEKILNTRVQLKYDSYSEWQKVQSTFKPLKGEICIVNPGTKLNDANAVPCLMKVGDGEHFFVDLPWISATAADVYAWAKCSQVSFVDQKIYFHNEALNENKTNAVKVLDLSIFVTGDELTTILNSYYTKTEADGKFALKSTVDNYKETVIDPILTGYVKSVSGKEAITSTGGQTPEITLKIDTAKNGTTGGTAVKLSQSNDGLKAEVDLTNYVQKDGDKVLSDNNYTDNEKTKLADIAAEATKVESSTNGKIKINGVDTTVYAHPVKHTIGEIDNFDAAVATIKVTNASHADTATSATNAANAQEAVHATNADRATTATTAEKVANSFTVNGVTFDGSAAKSVTIDAASLGLESAMHFIGAFATAPTKAFAGQTNERDLANGDVYLNTANNTEYVYSNSKWVELGNEGSHALKTVTITGTGYLTGGGDLTTDRTIDIDSVIKTKIDDAYSKATGIEAGSIATVAKSLNAEAVAQVQALTVAGATNAADSAKFGGQLPDYYATAASVTDITKTGGEIDKKIAALDVSDITGMGAGNTIATLTETDGKIAATFQPIAITKSQVTDFDHNHDNVYIKQQSTDYVGTIKKLDQTKGDIDKYITIDTDDTAGSYGKDVTFTFTTDLTSALSAAETALQSINAPTVAPDSSINTTEAKVPSGIKVTTKANNTQDISIDDSITFVFDCGSATKNV